MNKDKVSVFDYISLGLKNNNFNIIKLIENYDDFVKQCKSSMSLDSYKKRINEVIKILKAKASNITDNVNESELLEEAVNLAKSKQKFQDLIRINRKINRETFRSVNVLEEYSLNFSKELEKENLSKFTIKHKDVDNKKIAILFLSDLHVGETIENHDNIYNLDVTSKRLQKLAYKTKTYLKINKINNLLLILGGDIVNNSNYLDKNLTNSEHRSKASLQAAFLIEQFILDLNEDCNLTVTSVVGNESRLDDIFPNDERLITHNLDWTIFNILKVIFRNSKGVSFLDGNYKEKVIKVFNTNILILHGYDFVSTNIDKSIKEEIAKYSLSGINIRYILLGHVHSTFITPYASRSGGLPGTNGFSDSKNYIGRASMNLSLLEDDDSIDTLSIDLQNYNGFDGYDLKENWISHEEIKEDKSNMIIMKVLI